jgi:archaellum component FlaF (FlaF/FlaG flagellin family)
MDMGFSVSAAATVLFIASVVTFSTVVGAVYDMERGLHDARVKSEAMAREAGDTRLSIVEVNHTTGNISLLNDGSVVLDPRYVWVLLNGTLVDPSALSYEVEGIPGTMFFNPGETMVLSTGRALNDTLICVMTGNGIKASASG